MQNKNTNQANQSSRTVLEKVIIFFIVLILLGGVTGFFMLSQIVGKVSSDEAKLEEKIKNVEPTTVYDAAKKKIYELGAENRENIKYEQIPQVTIDAFLAIEDSRYFKHNGFDLPRFISSAFNNLKSGSFAQGGSTLTMQTIDNFINKPKEDQAAEEGRPISKFEQVEMKIQEIYLSMLLDARMSKEDILENYLNKINFGSSARGIQRGAQYYFGKDVEQLNLSESAFLAGVINAPNTYNPYRGYDKESGSNFYAYATKRRNETLGQMLNHGFISENQYKLAKSSKLAFQLKGEPEFSSNPYLAYALSAIEEAQRMTGVDPATTPMKIYTALETSTQKRLNDIQNKFVITMPDNPYYQVASSVIDNDTGEVIAIMNGFDDPATGSYKNRAIKERHQPGSTAKPLLAYSQAFDHIGWATSRILEDKPIEIYGQIKKNYNNKYHGKVSVERALSQSLNIPALQTMLAVDEAMGAKYMRNYMLDLGFDESVAQNYDLLYAIGGQNFVASPTQMASAFAALANEGLRIEPHLVRRIEFKDNDDNKAKNANPKEIQVMSPQAAYMTSDLLKKAVSGKYNSYNYMGPAFRGCGYPVYGKTGTSDWGELSSQVGGSSHDGWMINYTSEYTIASWNGFDQRVDGYSFLSENVKNMNIPGQINRYILDSLSSNAQTIQNPGGVVEYGGGLIKQEFLKDAAKNNPETITNVKRNTDELKKLIDKLFKLDPNAYTTETWKALQNLLAKAKTLIESGDATDDEVDKLKNEINHAYEHLDKKEDTPNTQSLQDAIDNAMGYSDFSKYQRHYVNELNRSINAGNRLLSTSNPSQSDIDNAIYRINSAIQECIDHPKCHGNDCYD